MAGGRSLTPFYAGLAILAAGGTLLIARQSGRRPRAPSLVAAVMPVGPGPRGVVQGNDSAPIEIAEYSDFECPYCARFAVLQLPDVKQRLVDAGRVRWRFIHFPLANHLQSPHAHLAAACAREQGRFWEMHDAIYAGQDEWVAARRPDRVLEGYAERLGLDRDRYRSCVQEQRAWPEVLADKALGDSLGVNATPTFYINGRLLDEGPPSYDRIRRIVDSLTPPAPSGPGSRPAAARR